MKGRPKGSSKVGVRLQDARPMLEETKHFPEILKREEASDGCDATLCNAHSFVRRKPDNAKHWRTPSSEPKSMSPSPLLPPGTKDQSRGLGPDKVMHHGKETLNSRRGPKNARAPVIRVAILAIAAGLGAKGVMLKGTPLCKPLKNGGVFGIPLFLLELVHAAIHEIDQRR